MLAARAEALDAAAAAERLGGADADAAFTLASAYEQLGERSLALKWLERAIASGYLPRGHRAVSVAHGAAKGRALSVEIR